MKTKTEYAVVYLHGFSASQEEGDPVHYQFAQKFGCNLYLSRLYAHGIDTTEPLGNFTAEEVWNSAKEAFVGEFAKEGNAHVQRAMRAPYDYSFVS